MFPNNYLIFKIKRYQFLTYDNILLNKKQMSNNMII